MDLIEVPAMVRDGTLQCIVSMSGGKDSTACALALREAGVSFRMVFADTGWEAPETYKHLDDLRSILGPIDVVGVVGGMVAKVKSRAAFPSRMQRWCTRELKIKPLREYHEDVERTGIETVCVVGIRAEESKSRAKMLAWEDDEMWGGWMWRPLLSWSVEDVLAIHHRHSVPIHPLYLRGHDRVGCFPCIFASKEEIRLTSEHAPWRIDEIRTLERNVSLERQQRNKERPDKYTQPTSTFFNSRSPGEFYPIDKAVEWSRTLRGGKQLPMYNPDPTGGCFRWGMCERPTDEE